MALNTYASSSARRPAVLTQPRKRYIEIKSSNGSTFFSQRYGLSVVSTYLSRPSPLLPRKGRHYKIILSLDGDGIRGLSQVFLVEALVGAICTKVNQNVKPYQIFDLIGGSSMGAALGLMLSRLRMQAHTAREAYKFIAREVFQDKKAFFSSLDPHTASHLYDAQGVEDAIKTVVTGELLDADVRLYDPREDSADAFVITTQVKLGSNKAAVLRSYHTRRIAGPELDDNIFVWQAMKAAVLAPRYACPENGKTWRSVIEPGLVDYGTTKDNPVSDAYYECRKLYKYTGDRMVIVSIGTGSGLNPDCESAEMAKSVYKRNGDAEQQCFEFQRDHEGLIKSGWLEYFRFNVPNLDDTPLEEWCNEELIRKKTTAYLASPDVGWSFHRCVDNITAILTGV
ncbi:hypothetical protein SLS60_003392 [Paraconiothyrium brasiliense]|uniref:PNPLA domain-containing protein n=1 Tax=Paraconiothyrium brasiliense TaxID=300254 RepID=A0ABR3RVJ3_9PLEO